MGALNEYLRDQYAKGIAQYAWRDRAKFIMTTVRVPSERKKAKGMVESGKPVRLHLGCGDTYREGWINIDLSRPGRRLDLVWDLRRGIPFPDGSVTAIFSEHLFEHIDLLGSLVLLTECRRVLASTGVIRVGVPNLERYIHSYLGQDPIIDEVRPGRPTRALALSEIFYFHGHRAMYDATTLAMLMEEAGFRFPTEIEFGKGSILPSPDSPSRRPETLYVEAHV